MDPKVELQQLKLQNEKLKNKTEKLKLVRNIAGVITIVLSLFAFIIGINKSNNPINVNSDPNTGVQQNTNGTPVVDEEEDDLD